MAAKAVRWNFDALKSLFNGRTLRHLAATVARAIVVFPLSCVQTSAGLDVGSYEPELKVAYEKLATNYLVNIRFP